MHQFLHLGSAKLPTLHLSAILSLEDDVLVLTNSLPDTPDPAPCLKSLAQTKWLGLGHQKIRVVLPVRKQPLRPLPADLWPGKPGGSFQLQRNHPRQTGFCAAATRSGPTMHQTV